MTPVPQATVASCPSGEKAGGIISGSPGGMLPLHGIGVMVGVFVAVAVGVAVGVSVGGGVSVGVGVIEGV